MVHDAYWNVALVEHCVELILRHLVIVLNHGNICGPPSTCRPMELLCCEHGLLELREVKQSKLRFGHSKSVISFKRIYRHDEHWMVSCQEVKVEGILRLLMVLRTSILTLINFCQSLHDDILQSQQLLEAH
jgi:hypothetical protein